MDNVNKQILHDSDFRRDEVADEEKWLRLSEQVLGQR